MATFFITLSQNPMGQGGLLKPVYKDVVLNNVVIRQEQIEPMKTSCREARAKRHARRLRAAGNRNVMLWKQAGDTYLPISLKGADHPFHAYTGHVPNHNSVVAGEPITHEGIGRTAGGRFDRFIRMNKGARAANNG